MDVSKETEDVLDAAPSEKGSPTKKKAPAKKAVAKKGNKKPGPSATAGTAMKNTKTRMVAQKKPPPKKGELIPDEEKDNVPKESPAKPAPQNASPGRNTRNRAARNTNSTVSENNSSGTSQGDDATSPDGSKETQEDSANLGDKKKGQGDSNSNLSVEKETQENISANLSGEKETQENISANLSGEMETQENSSANFDVRRGSLRNQNAKDTTPKKAVGERKIPSKPETDSPPAGGKKQLESKPASDKLKDSTTLVGKKASQNAPNLGEKKLTSNFGSLMASFFSRQLDDVASSPDKTSKDTDDKKEGQSQDDKEASTLNVGQPKQAARPGNQNQSLPKKDDTDEVSTIEIDQRKRSSGLGALLAGFGKRQNITPEASPSFPAPGNKRATKEPSSDKAEKSVNENTPEDQKVPVMKSVNEDKPKEKKGPVKKKQSSDDDASQAENEQRKVSSSIGALMAGFGKRPPPSAESPQTFSSPGRGRRSANNDPSSVMPDDSGGENEPVEKKSRVPEEKAKNNASKDGKTKKDSSNDDDSNRENEQRKVSSSIGALMAGFGKRPPPSAESPQTFSSPEQRKVSNSIGALLGGLGNRQRSSAESPQIFSSPGNRRRPVSSDPWSVKPDDGDENRPVEKKARGGSEEKAENDSSKDWEMKEDSSKDWEMKEDSSKDWATKTDSSKDGKTKKDSSKDGKTKKDSSNDDDGNRENEQRRVSSSIGALLAGLGNRQSLAAESSQPFSSPGNRRKSVTNDPSSVKPDDDENQSVEKKASRGTEEKAENDSFLPEEKAENETTKDWKTKKDSSNDDDGNRENEQRRVSSSIGALLAGLGNRQRSSTESHQPFSSPGNRRNSVTNDPSSVKPDDGDGNRPVEKRARRGPEENAENNSFLPEEKAEKDSSNNDSSHENEEILNGDPLATKASHPPEAKITHPLRPSQEKSLMFETDSVGGRLTLFKNKWRRSSWGHSVVKNGVSWKWKESKPKVQLFPQRSNRFINDSVAALLDEGVVEKAPFIAFQLRLRQDTDKRSEIFDLSTLNKYIECPYFKMTTIEHVRKVLPQGAWAISLELKEAYFHVPINKSFRKFLGFKIGDQKYHLKALPVGLNVAPMVLTRLTTHIVEMLQNQKIEVVVCLDDWLVWGDSMQACSRARDIVMNRLGDMGFCINLSKSQLIPKQNFEWLGVMWNTRSTEIALPSNEIVSTKNLAFCNQPEEFHCEQRKLSSSIGALLAGFSNRQHPAPESSQPFSSSGDESRPMQKRSVGPEGNKEGDSSKDGETTSSKKEFSDYDNHGREEYVETKKTNSIGSLLAGLGSRQQEFCNDDQQTSSSGGFRGRGRGRGGERFDSNRGHGDAQRGNRGFGDFGFVSDKFQRNTNKRTFEEFEHDLLQSSDDNSRRDEPVVKEEGDIVYVRGHIPKPKLTEKELEDQKKSLSRNLTFEEEAEKRKETGIGAMLASLANRSFPDPPPQAPRRGERDGGGFNGRRGRGGDDNRRGGRGFRKRGYEEDYDDDRGSKRFRDQDWDEDDRGDRRRWDRDDGKRGRKEKEPFDPKKAAEEMKSETERLEKEHGPGVFTVGFTEAKVMAYVCEICCVQLNKQTLEAHADGMQHLKKKNLYEKKKRIQALNKDDGKPKYSGGRTGWTKVDPDASKSGSSTPKLTPSTTPAPPDNGSGDGVYGYDGGYGQDGYDYNNQYYMQQQPSYGPSYMEMGPTGGYMMGPPTVNKNTTDWTNSQYSAGQMNTPAQAVPSPISTPVAPPPPPVTEAAPKPKPAKGGATVSLLQRLDACAVKNEKDLELASSVISALLKSLKEFNHKRGDTKFIEVLTEIDIKFRSLKPKVSSHVKSSKEVSAVSSKAYTSSAPQSAYATYSSSDASKYDNTLKNSPGTWYSQGRGNNPSSSYAQGQAVKPTSALEAVASNYSSKATGGYASQAAPKTSATGYAAPQGVKASSYAAHGTSAPPGYSAHSNYYSTSYPGPTTAGSKQTDNKEQSLVKSTSKDAEYYTRPPPATAGEYRSYSSKTGNNSVMEIIRSGNEPPPPPPPDTAPNYAGQGYQTGYYNTSAPPPQYNQQQY